MLCCRAIRASRRAERTPRRKWPSEGATPHWAGPSALAIGVAGPVGSSAWARRGRGPVPALWSRRSDNLKPLASQILDTFRLGPDALIGIRYESVALEHQLHL